MRVACTDMRQDGYQAEQIQAYSFAAGSTGAVFGQPYSMSETNPRTCLRNWPYYRV
jgi:hypothetical protein